MPGEKLMVPRNPTDEMVSAGLYNMPDGVEYGDVFTAWQAMFDTISTDGGCTTQLPALRSADEPVAADRAPAGEVDAWDMVAMMADAILNEWPDGCVGVDFWADATGKKHRFTAQQLRDIAYQPKGNKRPDPAAWIVSNGNGDLWRYWNNGYPGWTTARDGATRYARREDAEAVHADDEAAWRVEPYVRQADRGPYSAFTIAALKIDRDARLSELTPDEIVMIVEAVMGASEPVAAQDCPSWQLLGDAEKSAPFLRLASGSPLFLHSYIGKWSEEQGKWGFLAKDGSSIPVDPQPTHWLPLPSAPTVGEWR